MLDTNTVIVNYAGLCWTTDVIWENSGTSKLLTLMIRCITSNNNFIFVVCLNSCYLICLTVEIPLTGGPVWYYLSHRIPVCKESMQCCCCFCRIGTKFIYLLLQCCGVALLDHTVLSPCLGGLWLNTIPLGHRTLLSVANLMCAVWTAIQWIPLCVFLDGNW